jgi:hypothetical protein
MTYQYDLILKKVWRNEYGLFTIDGRKIFDIIALNVDDAYSQALSFMSSWSSVRISVESEIK